MRIPAVCCGSGQVAKAPSWLVFLVAIAMALYTPLASVSVQAAPQFAAMTVDARNGKVLFAQDADGIRHPASLTKMMTLYLLFQDLSRGKLTLASPIRISPRATGMAPSRLGAQAGDTITVETAIRALVVKSANDVACAVAETLEGSEKDFALRMTRTARSLGMSRTTFVNASGLPNPRQVTTARDMATLGLRLMRDFPQYYPYFRTRSFVYDGRTISGHNRLLGKFDGTDGIKTGFINASGFNLVSSVRRGDKRLVGVVLGGRTGAARDAYMMKMLGRYFAAAQNGKTIAAYAGSSKGVIVADEQQAVVADADDASSASAAATPPPQPARKKGKATVAAAAATDEDAAEGDGADEGIAGLAAQVSQQGELAAVAADQAQPVPPPLAASASALPFKVKSPDQQLADAAQVASITPAGDQLFTINLGDFATKQDAQALLQRFRKRSPELLSGKVAQTLTVDKGGVLTYRARFAGFDAMGAERACKAIRRQKQACEPQGPS